MIRKTLALCVRALPRRMNALTMPMRRFATNDPKRNKDDDFDKKKTQQQQTQKKDKPVEEQKPKQMEDKELKTKPQENKQKEQPNTTLNSKQPQENPENKNKTEEPKKTQQNTGNMKDKQQSTSANSQSSQKKQQNKNEDPKNKQNPKKWWQKWYEMAETYVKNYKPHPTHAIWLVLLYWLIPKRSNYTWQEFLRLLAEKKVKQVKVLSYEGTINRSKRVQFYLESSKGVALITSVDDLLDILKQYPEVKLEFSSQTSALMRIEQYGTFLTLIAILGLMYARKNAKPQAGAQMFDTGKKKFEMVKDVKVKFADVAGLQESKFEIQEFVDFLKFPQKYKEVGARIPKGALLTGPPGTGKTLLAKACAGQAGVPFFFTSGSDFVEMYVGLGAARVRDLFKEAKAMSPSIIFIDEIDAVGRKRHNKLGSNDQRDGTLNQLLVQMDGFGTDSKVIVMAATNRKELLDPALTRPGRFDRSIQITLPDLEGRKEIFNVHLTPVKLNPQKTKDDYAKRLATLTPGFSGAQIANICNQAAILAARYGKQSVDAIDFEMSTERVLGGVQRKSLMSEEERKVVAVHQSGHGVVSWFLKGAHPLLKLTIIPRSKGSLGFAQYLPSEAHLETREQLIDRICFILGGRCAEEHFFKRITTGAYDDLQKAHQIAYVLVTKLGMSEKIGNISFTETQYLKEYSEETGDLIDEEIKVLIDRCTRVTKELVIKHEDAIKALSQALLEKESLDGKEILRILGDRPFEPHSSYKAYLDIQKKDEADKAQKAQEAPKQLPQPNPGNTSV